MFSVVSLTRTPSWTKCLKQCQKRPPNAIRFFAGDPSSQFAAIVEILGLGIQGMDPEKSWKFRGLSRDLQDSVILAFCAVSDYGKAGGQVLGRVKICLWFRLVFANETQYGASCSSRYRMNLQVWDRNLRLQTKGAGVLATSENLCVENAIGNAAHAVLDARARLPGANVLSRLIPRRVPDKKKMIFALDFGIIPDEFCSIGG